MTDEQLAFEIEGMIHEAAVAAAPEWKGAPLHFTTAYYLPADLDAAMEHWQFLHKLDGSWRESRMWHRAITVPAGSTSASMASTSSPQTCAATSGATKAADRASASET